MTLPTIRHPDDITSEWLTYVLRQAGLLEHAVVDSFTTRTVGTGQMGASVRHTLRYDRPEERAPRSVVCKFASADPTSRATGLALRAYEAEVSFYRDVAHAVDIRTDSEKNCRVCVNKLLTIATTWPSQSSTGAPEAP